MRVLMIAGVAGKAEAGAAGFKAFACASGWDDFPPVDDMSLAAGCDVAAAYDLPVAVHCELPELGPGTDSEVLAVRWAARIARTGTAPAGCCTRLARRISLTCS